MTIKPSDAQLVLMSAAAQREDRCLVASQHLKGGAAKKIADKLLGAGLVREIRARGDLPVWRRDEDEGQTYALKLTAAGLKAIAVDDDAPAQEEAAAASKEGRMARPDRPAEPGRAAAVAKSRNGAAPVKAQSVMIGENAACAPREGSKLAAVVDLLRRPTGATLHELVAATTWLPHTTRAALTGLRKRDYPVALDKSDKARGSIYRIVGEAGQQASSETGSESPAPKAPAKPAVLPAPETDKAAETNDGKAQLPPKGARRKRTASGDRLAA